MQLIRLNLPLIYVFLRFYNHVESRTVRIKNTIILLMALIGKRSLHILLADDDKDDREIFMAAIQEISPDIEISVAVNGKDLMSKLHDEHGRLPDILFLDLNMPYKNGQECLNEIRNNDRLKRLPVIIYSTSSSSEYIDQTYKGGANYYLTKPDSLRDLKLIAEGLFSFDWEEHTRPLMDKFVLRANYFK
jgi:CheY-like chemotaxis protein